MSSAYRLKDRFELQQDGYKLSLVNHTVELILGVGFGSIRVGLC